MEILKYIKVIITGLKARGLNGPLGPKVLRSTFWHVSRKNAGAIAFGGLALSTWLSTKTPPMSLCVLEWYVKGAALMTEDRDKWRRFVAPYSPNRPRD